MPHLIKRFFIGSRIEEPFFKTAVASLQEEFKPLRPSLLDNLHLTFRYLGPEAEKYLPEITDILNKMPKIDFKLNICGLDYFTNQKGEVHTLYLKVEPSAALISWQKELNQQISDLIPLAFWKDEYHPHISIIRPKPHVEIRDVIHKIEPFKELSIKNLTCPKAEIYYKDQQGIFVKSS